MLTFFALTEGYSEGLDAFRFFFRKRHKLYLKSMVEPHFGGNVVLDQEHRAADWGCNFCTVGSVVLLFTLIHVSRAKKLQGTRPKVALSLKGTPKFLSYVLVLRV